jgi:poly(3-hydroxybutyrate) depolymerase
MMNPFSYQLHELSYLALAPARAMSYATRVWNKNPLNPMTHTHIGRNLAASAEIFERLTRRYAKPSFGFETVAIENANVEINERVVWEKPFCKLLRFERQWENLGKPQPKLLIVAPMSGHHATLLRGTVAAFLPYYDVYITDWADARAVPKTLGDFDLDDYIDYLLAICEQLSEEKDGIPLHTLGVCQPAVPLIAAVALLEAEGSPHAPASMTLMGGPIDTRRSPTAVNLLAEKRGSAWFRANCVHPVPFPLPGFGRTVYPGFFQLSGFMAMNYDRHVSAHIDMFKHLIQGDDEPMEKQREFYDEYLAVMDLTAEFYLQTIDTVFVDHLLPRGEMTHRGTPIDLTAIKRTALLTVEGEKDDISGIGQTLAAHDLCSNLPAEKKAHYEQKNVGHYGVFNGSRYRNEVAPRIRAFHAALA